MEELENSALIISGDILTEIENDQSVDKLCELADKMKVVIACRVSPK